MTGISAVRFGKNGEREIHAYLEKKGIDTDFGHYCAPFDLLTTGKIAGVRIECKRSSCRQYAYPPFNNQPSWNFCMGRGSKNTLNKKQTDFFILMCETYPTYPAHYLIVPADKITQKAITFTISELFHTWAPYVNNYEPIIKLGKTKTQAERDLAEMYRTIGTRELNRRAKKCQTR